MSAELALRRAAEADLPRLLSLYSLLTVADDPVATPAESARRYAEMLAEPRHEVWVAEREQQIVGTFALAFLPGLTHGARDSCIIEDVVVAPELQGGGIGKWMMAFAMERAARRDCYKIVLSSHLQRSSAHRFYESLGFARHGYSFLVAAPGDARTAA